MGGIPFRGFLYCAEGAGDEAAENELIVLTQHFLSTLIERTQTAQILARSLEERNEAQEVAQVGSFTFDLETRTCNYSAVTAKIIGWPVDSASTSMAEYKARIHPEDLPRVEQEVSISHKSGKKLTT